MSLFSPEVTDLAQILWDYHCMHQSLHRADVMLVLGSHDLRVASYAAKLFLEGYAPFVVISGGLAHRDDLLKTSWQGTEAEEFASILIEEGVPEEKILLEQEAKNTGENFSLSKKILDENGIEFQSLLAVTKPYMERRAFATGSLQMSDKEIVVTSPPGSFEEYFAYYKGTEHSPEDILNIMVGDLQRIEVYGKKGFQIPQEIPENVWNAFLRLKELGYTKHLLSEV
ncbi:MAG: YdcF family protein [Patescibacteria group bacterium]